MSRKDYKALADVVKRELERAADVGDDCGRAHTVGAIERMARAMADAFRADNSRFDYGRFYSACGLDNSGRVAAVTA